MDCAFRDLLGQANEMVTQTTGKVVSDFCILFFFIYIYIKEIILIRNDYMNLLVIITYLF